MKQIHKRKPMSEQQKRDISETLKKRWKEKEYREMMCNAHKHELPKEWRSNISSARKGIKLSEETKRRMSEAQKKLDHSKGIEALQRPEVIAKRIKTKMEYFKRIKGTEEGERVSREISKRLKDFYATPDGKEKRKRFSEFAATVLYKYSTKRIRETTIERKVEEDLKYFGIKYVKQKFVRSDERCFVLDFYLPKQKLVIEVNGDYWHNLQNRQQRDKDLKEFVEWSGRNIIFIWEHEIRDEWFCVLDYIGEYL